MTKEDIAKKYVPCRCDEAYTNRRLTAPDCPYHSTDPESAMDEYAKQQGAAFVRWMDIDAVRNGDDNWQWRGDNFMVNYTTEQLYEKFIEQQSKEK